MEIEVPTVLLYVSTMNENILLHFFVEFMFNANSFSQVLATVIKLFLCSNLHIDMYINSLNAECTNIKTYE